MILAGTSRARAADRSEDDLIREGVEARRRRADAEAAELFEKAYAIRHSARAAAQIGLAEVALGRWIEAEVHLTESLGARSDVWIKKNAQTLSDTLERVRDELGSLEVMGGPAGAEIVIAEKVRGTLPLASPVRVRVGEVHFELRAAGHVSETRTVRVKPRALVRETLSLSHLPPAPPPTPPPLARIPSDRGLASRDAHEGTVVTRPVPTEPDANVRAAGSEHPGRAARIAGIVAGGLGVATAGTGLWFGLKARAAGIDASRAPTHDPDASSAGKRDERLQWICYGAGAALLAGGVISYVVGSSRGKSSDAEIGFAPATAGGAGGIAWLRGDF